MPNFKTLKIISVNFFNFLLDLIFPKECAGCGKDGSWLCIECQKNIDSNLIAYCPFCQQEKKSCQGLDNCRSFYFDSLLIIGKYDEPIFGDLIKKMKYNFIKDIGGVLAGLFYEKISSDKKIIEYISTNRPVIIPVPLHRKRRDWRGFNQSEEIGKSISRLSGLAFDNTSLIKTNNISPQAKLNKEQRKKNAADAYECTKNMEGKYVFLIDDIVTTGATMNECAKTLKNHGAAEVICLAIAQG